MKCEVSLGEAPVAHIFCSRSILLDISRCISISSGVQEHFKTRKFTDYLKKEDAQK